MRVKTTVFVCLFIGIVHGSGAQPIPNPKDLPGSAGKRSAAGSAPAEPNQATERNPYILVIAKPELWSAPDERADRTVADWPAGRTLIVDAREESKLADASVAVDAGCCMEPQSASTTQDEDLRQSEEQMPSIWFHVSDGDRSGWLPDAYLAPPPPEPRQDGRDAPEGLPVNRERGLPPDYEPPDLVPVDFGLEDERAYRLRREAAGAVEKMIRAARRDGVKLYIVSGYRPWDKQQELYERKVRSSGLRQRTVAKPGHSEHQLGTAVDLTDGAEDALLREAFGDTAAGRWLCAHAPAFGFALSYTAHNQAETGYASEPWHYRYWGGELAPLKHATAHGNAIR